METLDIEERKFRQTLEKGLKLLDEEIEKYYRENKLEGTTIVLSEAIENE
jgi:alanyl-tRNA synthetase